MAKSVRKKGCLTVFLAVSAILVIMAVITFLSMGKKMETYKGFDFTKLDLSNIEDGTYTGSEDGKLVKVTVKVTVKDHKITGIDIIEHQNGKGQPAEAITKDIIEKNSPDVDAISGATLSSNVIKVAVYNALIGNMK